MELSSTKIKNFLTFFQKKFLYFGKWKESLMDTEIFYNPEVFFTLHSFPTFVAVPRVLRFWERFFYPQVYFTIHSVLTFGTRRCCTNLFSRIPWRPAVLSWSCRASRLCSETQICLFESHSFRKKGIIW